MEVKSAHHSTVLFHIQRSLRLPRWAGPRYTPLMLGAPVIPSHGRPSARYSRCWRPNTSEIRDTSILSLMVRTCDQYRLFSFHNADQKLYLPKVDFIVKPQGLHVFLRVFWRFIKKFYEFLITNVQY